MTKAAEFHITAELLERPGIAQVRVIPDDKSEPFVIDVRGNDYWQLIELFYAMLEKAKGQSHPLLAHRVARGPDDLR